MQLDDYQRLARQTAIYPDRGRTGGLLYTALGLCGESGEFADKVKKVLRDDSGVVTDERHAALKKELGDVLWYASQCASELGLALSEIAHTNLDKLSIRAHEGKLQGSGDNR